MKYYKYPNPHITDDEIAIDYFEVDGDLIMRQLSVFEDHYISSNVDLALGDQPLKYEEIREYDEDIIIISADEFNEVWKKHLQQHEARWAEAKKLFPINTSVTGCMAIFFPQGVIVELGQTIFGVTDYAQARALTSPEFMYTRYQISGIVTGYDETNQWIELGSPQIHSDKRCDLRIWPHPQK